MEQIILKLVDASPFVGLCGLVLYLRQKDMEKLMEMMKGSIETDEGLKKEIAKLNDGVRLLWEEIARSMPGKR